MLKIFTESYLFVFILLKLIKLSCVCVHGKLPQSCPTLCNPIDYSCAGSSVHEILQARILE